MSKSRHIQARLREDIVQEADAVAAYDQLRRNADWTDRRIITEALIALRQKFDTGYQPPEVETEITLTSKMQRTLGLIMEHVQMLMTVDLSSARQSPTWDEGRYQEVTSQLHASAADLFGAPKRYEDDEDT